MHHASTSPLRALIGAVLLAAVYPPAWLEGQDVGPPEVTLAEAVRLALERSPGAVAARGAVDAAQAGVLEARGAWLPSLSASTAFANSSNQRFDQTTGRLVSESYTARLEAGYDLFTGGRRLIEQRAATAGLRLAEARDRAARFTVILATTEAYYAAAAAEEIEAAARQRLERARRQMEFAETRLRVGTATRSDALRAELELGDAELALLEAESDAMSARLELGRKIGVAEPVEAAEDALPLDAPALPPLAALVERGTESSPEVLSAEAALDEAEADRWVSYSSYLPTVRATGGYDWFAFDFPPDQESWSLRLTASLPLFDRFGREAALVRSAAAERTAEALARDAEVAVRATVEDAARDVRTAERRIEIASRAIELAREDLRVQEERYRIGSATILELQTSQVALAEAEVAHVRARQELGMAIATLESVLGAELAEIRP